MELPETRPFEGKGRRKASHDFRSLYSHSSAQQDHGRPASEGSYIRTHDFLQPLEHKERKEEIAKAAPWDEHLLPGGIGTLTYESTANKGKTRKENDVIVQPISGATPLSSCTTDSAAKRRQWALAERASHSYSDTHLNSFNSLATSQTTGYKNQSYLEMIKSAKRDRAHDEDQAFILKKEPTNTQMGDLRVKLEGKSADQKPDTPRSKHSATEQRRRSKINDRFQMLRELIPRSDQKRDKASFLLEVIEYIHFLQEKVHKYERSYQGWNHEAEKVMPWRNNGRPSEGYVDQSRCTNGRPDPCSTLMFASKFDEGNITISPSFRGRTQNVESGTSPGTTSKSIDQYGGIINNAMKIPVSSESNFITSAQRRSPDIGPQLTYRLASDADNNIYQPSVQGQTYSSATEGAAARDNLKEKKTTIEGSAISMSSVYSRGLLNTLTQELQSSGVDLSRGSISVQIELGKQANIRQSPPKSGTENDALVSRNQDMARSTVANTEDSEQPVKKLKTRRS